jgi:hypothetical protein
MPFQHIQTPHVFRFLQSGIKTKHIYRLYEFLLEKGQPRTFANNIQANLKQTLKKNLTFSVVPMPVYRVNKKC